MQFIGNSLVSDTKFSQCMAELVNFYGKTLTAFQIEVYRQAIGKCREVDDASLVQGVMSCMAKHSSDGRFFPSADKIIQYAVGTPEERAARRNQEAVPALPAVSPSPENQARMKAMLGKLHKSFDIQGQGRVPSTPESLEERAKENAKTIERWQEEGMI